MGRRYLEFLHRLDGVDVTAVCDIRADITTECARLTGAQTFADAAALASSPEVDAVFVCTPEHIHLDASLAAINAGKALMIEKPVAHSLAAAQAIREAANSKGALVMVGHLLRFEPRWAAAKRVIAAGDLGEVASISTRRIGNILDQNVLKGRTSIPLYYGVHDLDIVHWYAAAQATTIYASRRSGILQAAGYNIHDLYSAVLQFENNILATAELGWHVPPNAVSAPTSGITVVGTKGWLKVEQAETGLQFWSESNKSSVHPIIDTTFWPEVHGVPGGALANELRHFLDCAQHDRQPIISLDDAYEALRLSLAMEASADQGAVIQLADFG
jgi:myo-inositol 2-dehydrogenase/D-chiro-inositol 1-dehydrogenase